MKLRLYIGGLVAFSVLFSSCGKDSEEGESFEPHTYNVSGKVEKGPFCEWVNHYHSAHGFQASGKR